MFVCLTNDTTYLTGNEGQIFRGLKTLRCKARVDPALYVVGHFIAAENAQSLYIRPRGGKPRFGGKTFPVL